MSRSTAEATKLKAQIELLKDELAEEKMNRNRIGQLEMQLAQKDKELLEIMPMLSIRKQIEFFEYVLAPEYQDSDSMWNHPRLLKLKACGEKFNYHEAKWHCILAKVDDERVKPFLSLLATHEIPEDQFCHVMASFFQFPSPCIRVPHLSQYTVGAIEQALLTNFVIKDATINCVTKVLMKVVM